MSSPATTLQDLFWRLTRQNWLPIVALGAITLASQGVSLALPLLTKWQIDLLSASPPLFLRQLTADPLSLFVALISVVVLLQVVDQVLNDLNYYIERRVSLKLTMAFRQQIFERLSTFDASLLTGKRSWFIARAATDGSFLLWDLNRYGAQLLQLIFNVVVIIPVIVAADVRLLGVVGITSVLQLYLLIQRVKLERAAEIAGQTMSNQRWVTEEALEGDSYLSLTLLGDEQTILKKHEEYLKLDHRLQQAGTVQRNRLYLANSAVEWVGVAILTYLVGRGVLAGTITLGTFTLLISYTYRLQGTFRNAFDLVQKTAELRLSLQKVGYIFSLRPSLRPSANQPIRLRRLTPTAAGIKLVGVSFRYPDLGEHERQYLETLYATATSGQKLSSRTYLTEDVKALWEDISRPVKLPLVLNRVTVTINPRTLTALVGPNGAGKTTLARLLTRCYDPTSGQIELNGRPLWDYDRSSLRAQISLLSQDPFLVSGLSVADNLRLGSARVATSRLWSALKELDADRFVQDLPKGIDTLVDRDIQLSGGQRQLLAAARVLVQRRPIIIYDEATSQLDAGHEQRFLRSCEHRRDQTTTILITHRLTTARRADQIFVLDRGRVTEQGKHSELLKNKKGLYSRFWHDQVGDS